MTVDHLSLLPAYLAAGTAAVVLLTDLVTARRGAVLAAAALGTTATGAAAALLGRAGPRETLCTADSGPAVCAWRADGGAALTATLLAALALGVLALAAPLLRDPGTPAGEWAFLLAAATTGGVILGYAADLVTLVIAVETLTLPLYLLVTLRSRRGAAGASPEAAAAGLTYFTVSVVAGAVTLLGAALVYAAHGTLHLAALASAPAAEPRLAAVGGTLLAGGLAVKVAAVPVHAWAPPVYDRAALPVAALLSTASKVGGVVALLAVWQALDLGLVIAVIAATTMTVGNLGALRQRRMLPMLAWSSIAQLGYVLAAVALRDGRAAPDAAPAALGYLIFFVVIEFGAFAALVGLRGAAGDGGPISAYTGLARAPAAAGRRRYAALLALSLVGLAGLPPGLAGLFAKVTVTQAALAAGATWLALLIAANTVLALAYYLPAAAVLYRSAPCPAPPPVSPAALSVGWAAAIGAVLVVTAGFAPQSVLDLAAW